MEKRDTYTVDIKRKVLADPNIEMHPSIRNLYEKCVAHDDLINELIAQRPERFKSYVPKEATWKESTDITGKYGCGWGIADKDTLIYHLAPELFEPGAMFGLRKQEV